MRIHPDAARLIVAGTVEAKSGFRCSQEHGTWSRELESGNTSQIAQLNDDLSRSMGDEPSSCLLCWCRSITVDGDGWIRIGAHSMLPDETSIARLLGV